MNKVTRERGESIPLSMVAFRGSGFFFSAGIFGYGAYSTIVMDSAPDSHQLAVINPMRDRLT